MANIFLDLPAPAANGSGAAVDVSTMGATKTLVVEGNGSTIFEPFVQIEFSNDDAHLIWSPLVQFRAPGEKTVNIACRWLRATVSNYVQGGAPTCAVGSNDIGTQAAELVAPANNGVGAGVDISALGDFTTIQVSGAYKGACNIEVSNDGETSWAQVVGMSFVQGGAKFQSAVIVGEFLRVVRTGISTGEANPGLPIVDVCGSETAGGGGGAGANATMQVNNTWDDPMVEDAALEIGVTYVSAPEEEGITVTLPAAADNEGQLVGLNIRTDADADVTIAADGTDTIEGQANVQIGASRIVSLLLVSDGVNTWTVVADRDIVHIDGAGLSGQGTVADPLINTAAMTVDAVQTESFEASAQVFYPLGVSGGAAVATLPAAGDVGNGAQIGFHVTDDQEWTVEAEAGDAVNGGASITLTGEGSLAVFISDGNTAWWSTSEKGTA